MTSLRQQQLMDEDPLIISDYHSVPEPYIAHNIEFNKKAFNPPIDIEGNPLNTEESTFAENYDACNKPRFADSALVKDGGCFTKASNTEKILTLVEWNNRLKELRDAKADGNRHCWVSNNFSFQEYEGGNAAIFSRRNEKQLKLKPPSKVSTIKSGGEAGRQQHHVITQREGGNKQKSRATSGPNTIKSESQTEKRIRIISQPEVFRAIYKAHESQMFNCGVETLHGILRGKYSNISRPKIQAYLDTLPAADHDLSMERIPAATFLLRNKNSIETRGKGVLLNIDCGECTSCQVSFFDESEGTDSFRDSLTLGPWPSNFVTSFGRLLFHRHHHVNRQTLFFENWIGEEAQTIALSFKTRFVIAVVATHKVLNRYAILKYDLIGQLINVYQGGDFSLSYWISDAAEILIKLNLVAADFCAENLLSVCGTGWSLVQADPQPFAETDEDDSGPIACGALLYLISLGDSEETEEARNDLIFCSRPPDVAKLRAVIARRFFALQTRYFSSLYCLQPRQWPEHCAPKSVTEQFSLSCSSDLAGINPIAEGNVELISPPSSKRARLTGDELVASVEAMRATGWEARRGRCLTEKSTDAPSIAATSTPPAAATEAVAAAEVKERAMVDSESSKTTAAAVTTSASSAVTGTSMCEPVAAEQAMVEFWSGKSTSAAVTTLVVAGTVGATGASMCEQSWFSAEIENEARVAVDDSGDTRPAVLAPATNLEIAAGKDNVHRTSARLVEAKFREGASFRSVVAGKGESLLDKRSASSTSDPSAAAGDGEQLESAGEKQRQTYTVSLPSEIPQDDESLCVLTRNLFTAEREYLANLCGNNIITPEVLKKCCERCYFLRLDTYSWLSLPTEDELRDHWVSFHYSSPDDLCEKFRSLNEKFDLWRLFELPEDSDCFPENVQWCFWELNTVVSLITFVLHELHPVDVQVFFWYGPTSEADLKGGIDVCRRLHPSIRFLLVIGTTENHYYHYVIDIKKGTCNVFDPYAETKMKEHKEATYYVLKQFLLIPGFEMDREVLFFRLDGRDNIDEKEGAKEDNSPPYRDMPSSVVMNDENRIHIPASLSVPFVVILNDEQKSNIYQQLNWTCPATTVVKVVESLIRLHLFDDVEFVGDRANQRMIDEHWNSLGGQVAKKKTSHQRVWEGSRLDKGDSAILDYCLTTLVRSFQDGLAMKELTADRVLPQNRFIPPREECNAEKAQAAWELRFPWCDKDTRWEKLKQLFDNGMRQRGVEEFAWKLWREKRKSKKKTKGRRAKGTLPWYVSHSLSETKIDPSWEEFRQGYLSWKEGRDTEPTRLNILDELSSRKLEDIRDGNTDPTIKALVAANASESSAVTSAGDTATNSLTVVVKTAPRTRKEVKGTKM